MQSRDLEMDLRNTKDLIDHLNSLGWTYRGLGMYLWMDIPGGYRMRYKLSSHECFIYDLVNDHDKLMAYVSVFNKEGFTSLNDKIKHKIWLKEHKE